MTIDLMKRSSDCSPEGEKMPMLDKMILIKDDRNMVSADFMNDSGELRRG